MRTSIFGDRCRPFAQLFLVLFLVFGNQVFGEDSTGHANNREALIRISPEMEGGVTHLIFENLKTAAVTVSLEMELVNLESSLVLPNTITLSPLEKRKWLSLSPKDSAKNWRWHYKFYSTFGATTAKHNDSYVYALPFAPGKSFRVSQGYNSSYSHFGHERYAVDWQMPSGTPVHAAREGEVVGIKHDSDVGGNDSKFDWDANYILVRHSDETLGQYVHLIKGGALVRVGQKVGRGEPIGFSGNTGHSTGPHLHFSVFKARDGKLRETIPVRFEAAKGEVISPVEGRVYTAPSSQEAVSLAEISVSRSSP